nr:divergent protein kinase domain 2B isoform X2 [Anolis sagrei ordinatus]
MSEMGSCLPHLSPQLLLSLLGWSLSCCPFLGAAVSPSSGPRVRPSYSFGRTFLGLDKCNACIGTSICKKFFKEEIRFDSWLSSNLKLPPNYLSCYSGNYSDDSKSWRPVEISRLTTKYQHDQSDKRICTSLIHTKSCSIERALWKTERFQKWLKAKRLTPDLVQIFPGAEGWPFPKYLGSCGRLIVTTSTRPLKAFYGTTPEVAADLALQLLAILESMANNDLSYFFYFTHVDTGTFGVFSDGHLFIRDASTLGVIDKQEGSQWMDGQEEEKDIFSCLVTNCQSVVPSCNSIKHTQSLSIVCAELLSKLLKKTFLSPVQKKIDEALNICADSSLTNEEIVLAAQELVGVLKPLRTCDSHFTYRYPDCKYSVNP